ncbi:MAG: hypothetical protein EBY18_04550 [Alphaproteobacteria bacterium]|nr:hypothetical protein [Alphaproteobacteria bacterium]
MGEGLLAALNERPRFASLTSEDLEPLPATGTAHGHVRLPDGLIARVAYAYEGDAGAAVRLDTQAAAFRLLAPSKCTPLLHDILPPRAGLPGGALIVDRIVGHAPVLPRDLGAMATSLAAMHSLPKPAGTSPISRQEDPFLETLEVVEQNARRFLDQAVPDPGARADVADELPGGTAWFVDLEKVHVGAPAIDLAHATLPTSTLWHPDVGQILTRGQVAGFYAHYLARIGEARAAELEPWLMPMRRLTWLRTTMFMARWRVQTRQPRDPGDPGQWSDAGLEPAMKLHLQARIDECFDRDAIHRIRAEWL